MDRKIKILYLSTSANDVEKVNDILKVKLHFDSQIALTLNQFKDTLDSYVPDLILAGHALPDMNCFPALDWLQQTKLNIPFIVVAPSISVDAEIELFDKGVTDYIDLHRPARLFSVLENFLQRLQLEDEVNKNEKRYRALIEHGEHIIVVMNEQQYPIYMSPSVQSILGYTIAEAMAISQSQILHPDDRNAMAKVMAECLANPGMTINKHVSRFKHKNGTWRWMESTITNWLHDPAIRGIVDNIRDVTDHLIAEKKLVDSSNALQKALNEVKKIMASSLDLICSMDKNDVFINVSGVSEQILGYKPEEMIGKNYMDFVHAEEIETAIKITTQIKNGIPVNLYENRFVHKDGSLVSLFWSAQFDETDQLTYATAKDATERKRLEFAFDMERQRFNELFFQAPSSMGILKGPNHIFEVANPLYMELIGKTDIIGKSLIEVLPNVADQGFVELLDEVYETGKTLSVNEMLATVYDEQGNPKDVYINLSYQAYRNTEGAIEGIFFFAVDVSKEFKARKEIEESEKRYRQIVETSQEGIWLLNECNITTFVNKKLCEILGYSPEEMLGKSIYDFMDEGEQIVAGQLEVKFISKKDTSILACVSSNSIFDDKGVGKGLLIMVSDITEKKKLEDLLSKANSMARIGSFEYDVATNEIYWSPITKEIHEVEDSYVPDYKYAPDFIKPGINREKVDLAFKNALKEGGSIDVEFEIYTAKSKLRWVKLIGETEIKNGKILNVHGSFQDIDDRKRAEINLQKAYEEKNTILESFGDAFFAVDESWIVTYWNKHAEKLLDCPRSAIINKNIWCIFSDPQQSPFYIPFHKAMEENAVQDFETFYEKLDCWFDVTAYPSLHGLSIYLRDVTERKLSEIHTLELNKDLEKYTHELVVSNKELEQFSYIISHNLRSPVANIIGLVEELKDNSHTEETRKMFFAYLSASVKLLDETINDLNTILQVKNKIDEIKEVVNFSMLIANIYLSIQNLFNKEQVVINTNFDEVNELLTLKSYMHSIFFNLISNSIKYSQPHLSPVIDIKSEFGNGEITLYYKDNGLGIDLEKRGDEVFGLYKRFHDHVDGRGMGLFMVKTQVQTLGGKITIASEINKGTEFKLVFPLN